MPPSISCFNYDCDPQPFHFIFIKFDKFIIIYVNLKSVVLPIKKFVSNVRLFQVYILSLLLTEDVNKIDVSKVYVYKSKNGKYLPVHGTWTKRYFKEICNYEFIPFYTLPMSNPMELFEPIKRSKDNIISNFFKYFNGLFNDKTIEEPTAMIENYFKSESTPIFDYFQKYIQYEKKIEMQSVILHNYGRDVYCAVQRFL